MAAARARVDDKLGYTCSAGIAPTKILAKLASGLHKPRQQTVVAFAAIPGDRVSMPHDLFVALHPDLCGSRQRNYTDSRAQCVYCRAAAKPADPKAAAARCA